MEKLKSVDLKNEKPARPGAPLFGRPNGTVSSDRISLSSAAKEMAFQETMGAGRNPKEQANVNIAKEVARKFFETRLDEPVAAVTSQARETVSLEAPSEVGSSPAEVEMAPTDIQA